MAPRAMVPFLALALLGLFPTTSAHSVFEASELEIHMLNDEGSDAIEAYGGYDIQEVFVGFAHYKEVGAGPAGDGIYLRAELYGDRAMSTVPQEEAAWSVTFNLEIDGQPLSRTISTTDGLSFTHDFDYLDAEVEARDTHINRAFISYQDASLMPGQTVTITGVESRVDGDLRDVSPGGIPIPGTNGLQEYTDPTAIEGSGVVTESVVLEAPERYLVVALASSPGRTYDVVVQSGLKEGDQHAIVEVRQADGWVYQINGSTTLGLKANASFVFQLLVEQNGTAPLELDVLTDVGGRVGLTVLPNGTMTGPGGQEVRSEPAPKGKDSPSIGFLVLLGALASAAFFRRNE